MKFCAAVPAIFRSRFSLRTTLIGMFILCAALAVVMGRLGSHAKKIKTIETNGGVIGYKNDSSMAARLSIALFADKRLLDVDSVAFNGSPLNDESCRVLAQLRGVTTVSLTNAALSRQDLDALSEGTDIRELNIHGCRFADATLESLARFPALESLDLGMSDASDDAVPAVMGKTSLRKLYIHGTQITDGGLARLQALPNLQRMTVSRHLITCDAIEAFSRQRPTVILQVFGPKCPDK